MAYQLWEAEMRLAEAQRERRRWLHEKRQAQARAALADAQTDPPISGAAYEAEADLFKKAAYFWHRKVLGWRREVLRARARAAGLEPEGQVIP